MNIRPIMRWEMAGTNTKTCTGGLILSISLHYKHNLLTRPTESISLIISMFHHEEEDADRVKVADRQQSSIVSLFNRSCVCLCSVLTKQRLGLARVYWICLRLPRLGRPERLEECGGKLVN